MNEWTSQENSNSCKRGGRMASTCEQTSQELRTLGDLLRRQIAFQKQLGNILPESYDNVSFDNVQSSLSHNIYQSIELQELMEADANDRKEELIDYLLFMLNKYIYLGVDVERIEDYHLLGMLFSNGSCGVSFYACSSLAQTEQQLYMSLIRCHTTFKPWKVRGDQTCTNDLAVFDAFLESLDIFKQMANIVYKSYQEFYETLVKKLNVNVERQNSGY